LTFRALLDLIWEQMQARLDARVIEGGVVFAAGHKSEASQVGERSRSAILSIEPKQGAFSRKLARCEVARDGREALTQFLSVAPVTLVTKRTEPLKAVCLADDGPRPHDLPTLAPGVARSTDLIQPTMSRGQILGLGQSALAGGLARAIDIKDYLHVPDSIR
jgi:hypothetical protein